MSSAAQLMRLIRRATQGARMRTGDQTLGTRVGGGTMQVVRVIACAPGPGCDVVPLTGYLPIADSHPFSGLALKACISFIPRGTHGL